MNLKSFSELFILASFYFSTLCFKVIDKNLFVLYFVCCSIFKDRFAPLVSSAHVVYHIILRLSTPFFKFFLIFSPFSRNVKEDHQTKPCFVRFYQCDWQYTRFSNHKQTTRYHNNQKTVWFFPKLPFPLLLSVQKNWHIWK